MEEARGRCPVCRGCFRTGFAFCPSDGAPLDAEGPDPLVGETIADRYRIEALIGAGASGRVYRARHVRLSRSFAVKVLREIYDFITGGSIAAPIGLAVAILAVILLGHDEFSSYVFITLILLTLLAATREKIA